MTVDPRAFAGRRVLVTGGLGFIGSNLVRRLVDLQAEVAVLDCLAPEFGGNRFNLSGVEPQIQIAVGDLRDESLLAALLDRRDYLFNLAGQSSHEGSMQDAYTDLEINAAGQLALLRLCREKNPAIRIVYAGTRQVYGRPRYLPVDENHPLEPVDYNGVSKMAGEWYHLLSHRMDGLWTTNLRMTNVYGPRMRIRDARQMFMGWWLHQAVVGGEIPVFGTGQQIRDFNYVDDVVEALLLSVTEPSAAGQVFNLGGDEPVSLLDLARLIVELNGGSYRLVDFPAERARIDIGDYTGDYTRARMQLGWRPKVPLRDGLERTLAFYRKYKEHYF